VNLIPGVPEAAQVPLVRILDLTARRFGVSLADIRGDSRERCHAVPRMIAMAAVYDHLCMSYPQVGRIFGRDHTTVMHARKRVDGSPPLAAHREAILAGLADYQPAVIPPDVRYFLLAVTVDAGYPVRVTQRTGSTCS